jgi:polar amino acid transport system permease protein/polar amino acid transport system substrate-binding protein
MDFIHSLIEVFRDSFPLLLKGAGKTFQLAFLSLIVATILGLFFGMLRISKNKFLRFIAHVYLSIIRGTPLYVQLVFSYFVLLPIIFGQSIDPFTAGALALSLNAGAYLVEIFRGGIESIDKGQMEAGRAIGFTHFQTMRYIILPQAVKRMVPSFVNQFIITLKDTSLLSTIGIMELMYSGQTIYSVNFKTFEVLTIVALMYWLIVTLLTMAANWIERRMAQS